MGGGGSLKRRAAFGVLLAGASLWFWQSLPEPLFSAPLSSALYARDGRLLGARIAADGQWRFAPSSEVSEKFSQALMLYEDQRFLAHPGVDPLAIARAARQNWRASRVVSGGSTLTMQVARLSRGNPPRSWGEKLREALLALRLELRYSKPELLALYAAHAPFGGNVVGLEAAAWRYFGHAPAQLSWAEAATLAVLPNSPALIHPARGRAQLQAKRDRLLASLHERGALDALGLQLAQSEALPAAPLPLPRLAPHLLDSLTARQGALHTRSSLDPALQEAVAARLNAHLRRLAAQGVHNGAALIFDNRDFSTLAYVGNRSDTTDAERGYAVDLVQRPRSTGSLLKPLLYAAQLEAGQLSPRSLIPDTPMRFLGFTPENFDRQHRGAVRAQEALALSLNVPAVHNLRDYGVAAFYDLLRQLGLSSLFRTPDGYGLTLVLGGAEASLWELASLYANLARVAQSAASRATAQLGSPRRLLDETLAQRPAPFGAGSAWLTLQALQEVSRPEDERDWKSFASSRRLAWKTGTSQGQRDGWAIGVTPHHTLAVWVGNASGEGMAGLTGAGMAAPLLFELLHLLPDSGAFREPVLDLETVMLCRDDGYLPDSDCATETQHLPAGGRFQRPSPYHLTVHLDATRRWRVHSGCEPVAHMHHESWLVLPPAQEFYYRQHQNRYRTLPRFRPDCQRQLEVERGSASFEIVYPSASARLYIPTELGNTRSRVVLQAAHRRSDARLYWHLDGEYLAQTGPFHQLALDIPPGEHLLTLVDEEGARQTRRFTVLEKNGVP